MSNGPWNLSAHESGILAANTRGDNRKLGAKTGMELAVPRPNSFSNSRPGRAMLMEPPSNFRNSGRDLVSTHEQADTDREALRNWSRMLRKEAGNLREQATHVNTVAGEAEALAERIESLLRGS